MGTATAVLMVLLFRERIHNRAGLERASDVVQVRRRESALASKHMTVTALAFAPEDLFAVRDIAGQGVVHCRPTQRVDICSDYPDFIVRKLLWAHECAWNAVLDRIEHLPIGSAEICVLARCNRWADLTVGAIGSMAASAALSVETLALVNSLGFALEWIYGSWGAATLRKNRTDSAGQKQPCDHQHSIHGLTSCKPKAKIFVPAAIARNCSPSTLYVIGLAVIRSPVLKCHSGLPLLASSTVTCPNCSGANTIPPPVDSRPGP